MKCPGHRRRADADAAAAAKTNVVSGALAPALCEVTAKVLSPSNNKLLCRAPTTPAAYNDDESRC